MNLFRLIATTDVGKDLFSDAWTEGNLYQIQGLTEALGSFACTVISVVGFGIVIFSILKNAMSGLYVVNPTFWDKVDEVKSQAVSNMQGTVNDLTGKSGNYAAQKIGGVFTFLLGLIPNIKALTDFDDDVEIDKKQYFMKSIPLLVAQIFIGMLIFFGYPAKIAEWIGDGATYAISAVINNVDPVQVVQGVSDKFTVYTLSTDGSVVPMEKVINKMSAEMTTTVATKYSDMKKQPTQETALAIESNLLTNFTNSTLTSILGADEGYNITISATAQSVAPTVSESYRKLEGSNVWMAQATNGTYSFKYWIQATTLPTGSTMVGSDDYFVWTIQATPVAVSNTSTANLIIFGGINTTGTTKGSTVSYTINGITVGSNSGSDVKGTLGQSMVVEVLSKDDGNVLATYNAILQTASINQSSGATPILTFNSSDRATINGYIQNGDILKVNLVGSWSYDIVDNMNDRNTLTLKVNEFRLVGGVMNKTGALSTWTGLDNTRKSGDEINVAMTKRSNGESW